MTLPEGAEPQRSILLADPVVPVRRFMKKFLRGMGHAVKETETLDGLAAEARGVDLIVLNVDLLVAPQADAEIQSLRKQGIVSEDTPVILLSEREGAEAGRVVAAGPSTWLARSASVLEVMFTINELLFPEGAASRSYGRVYGGFEVEFTPAGAAAGAIGLIYNVSRTGAYVETTRLPEEGEALELVLRLPDQEHPMTVRAEVVRVNAPGSTRDPSTPSGFAVQFVDLDAAFGETLERFVQQHRVR